MVKIIKNINDKKKDIWAIYIFIFLILSYIIYN